MIRFYSIITLCFACLLTLNAQHFSGVVKGEKDLPISNVKVLIVETGKEITTHTDGTWSYVSPDKATKTIVFKKTGYAYEQAVNQHPNQDIITTLRKTNPSKASLREEVYKVKGCNTVQIPNSKKWNVSFEQKPLKGDLAPDNKYSRRDPSAVIKVDGVYYIYYSYSLTFDTTKIAPWDLNDLYYATSTDGWNWKEQGIAIGRGKPGSFDHRSVFTTEVLANNGKYYLVYQAAGDVDGIYNRNVVGMAQADNPNGPWTKLKEPVLYPTYTNDLFFDNNAVHDPCIVPYKGKFYLYYKGECNCRDNADCKRWCNPICGYRKQVKWGVAIADSPTGPFKKSAQNPVTNTGHEVMVWPFADGIAILQHQDGPEANTIQYSTDGVNFEIMGSVSNIPEAAGLLRSEKSISNPHAGITWGVAHVLKWDAGPKGWMYINRFDIVPHKAASDKH